MPQHIHAYDSTLIPTHEVIPVKQPINLYQCCRLGSPCGWVFEFRETYAWVYSNICLTIPLFFGICEHLFCCYGIRLIFSVGVLFWALCRQRQYHCLNIVRVLQHLFHHLLVFWHLWMPMATVWRKAQQKEKVEGVNQETLYRCSLANYPSQRRITPSQEQWGHWQKESCPNKYTRTTLACSQEQGREHLKGQQQKRRQDWKHCNTKAQYGLEFL